MSMKKSVALTSIVLGSMLFGSSSAFANKEDISEFNLDQMVVTATRTEVENIKVPASVHVVTAEDIKKKNVLTVVDAIKMIPGVFDNKPGGMSDVANGIQVRGFGEDDILVLYDGMVLNDGYNSKINWNVVAIDDIEKIEVVKGAASALYGGHAVGAVINIISKEPDRDKVRAYVQYGSDKTWKRGINLAKKFNDKWSVGIGYENRETKGHPKKIVYKNLSTAKASPSGAVGIGAIETIRNTGVGIAELGNPGGGGSKDHTFNLKIKYKFDDSKDLSYRYTYDRYKYFAVDPVSHVKDANGNSLYSGSARLSNGKYINFSESDFTDYDGRRTTHRHAISYNDKDNKIRFNAGLVNVSDYGYATGSYFDSSTPGSDSKYPSKSYKADFQKVWESKNNTLVAGFDIEKASMDKIDSTLAHWGDKDSVTSVTSRMGGTNFISALFVQDEYKLNKNMSITAGLRFDRYQKKDGYYKDSKVDLKHAEESYTQLSPKLAFTYTPDDNTTLYASYGRSFKAPTLYQLFRDASNDTGYKANPGLKPETTDSFEIGVKKKVNDKTFVGLTLYQAKTKDMIAAATYPDGKHKWYVNIDNATRRGVEFELNHKFNDKFSGYFNYAFQDAKDGEKERIYSIPKHLMHIGVKYNDKKWNAYIDGEYASDRNEPGYVSNKLYSEDSFFIVNIGAGYKIAKNATLNFAINNLFNREYWQWYQADGRSYHVGLQYEF